jgi:hypothetical protein
MTTSHADTIEARIYERGNGLPSNGELCYDAHTDSVYRCVWTGSIETHYALGNSLSAQLEYVGTAADIEASDWADMVDYTVITDNPTN